MTSSDEAPAVPTKGPDRPFAAFWFFPILASVGIFVSLAVLATAAAAQHFDPDTDPSRLDWTKIDSVLGPLPDVRGRRFGVVLKTQTNEYWRLMTLGYRKQAAKDGVKLDIQAAQNESDPTRQLSIMANMIGGQYEALLISPQSASNMKSAIDDAITAKIPVLNVDGDVVDSVTQFIGPVNRTMGERVAGWFIGHYPGGGQVAVIEGQAGVLATVHRTAGFRDALLAAKGFRIVASASGQWDRQKAYDVATTILRETPDLIGIYCNNDVMALGVVEAVRSMNRLKKVHVFGSDGTSAAYTSIKAGDLTGTVDIFPMLVGELSLQIAERLAAGQSVPRVIQTPQALITIENIARFSSHGDSLKALLNDAKTK